MEAELSKDPNHYWSIGNSTQEHAKLDEKLEVPRLIELLQKAVFGLLSPFVN